MFKKVLIANRGEIAVRIIRTCKLLGVGTVAVYSDADSDALHVRLADWAVRLGSSAPGESYLNVEKIVRAASETGVDAVHPGYGFVSENWNLAARCEEAGITFVGPSSRTLAIAGNKTDCKKIAESAGVPVIRGSDGVVYDEKEAKSVARSLGYPVLLKSAFGGGGRGIREAWDDGQVSEAFSVGTSETKRSLGRVGLFIERLVKPARHIEVQVVADGRGAVVQLGERECSIQRRRQKLLEIAPAPGLEEEDRSRVRGYALALAKALGYRNAGTVEFLMDAERNFYFIEMNSRLQVEHPVTEVVTGVDIVKAQLEISAGDGIGYSQADVALSGTAIECRINAEDPADGFSPSSGRVDQLFFPGGADVRIDSALCPGCEVHEYYDSLVAKLIASGRTFEEARRRMAIALEEFKIEGVKTTIPLHRLLLENEAFKRQEFDVSFMERHQIAEQLAREMDRREASLLERGAVLAASLIELGETANGGMSPDREGNSAQERGAPRHYDAI